MTTTEEELRHLLQQTELQLRLTEDKLKSVRDQLGRCAEMVRIKDDLIRTLQKKVFRLEGVRG